MDWAALIDKIPDVFVYIAPGIIFLVIWGFICNKKTYGDNRFFVFSMVLSFIITTATKLLISNNKLLAISTLLLAVVSSVILGLFFKSRLFQDLMAWVGINKTIHDSIWDEIMDEYDIYIKLYISTDRVIYYGLYKGHEEKNNDLYVLITSYDVEDYDGKQLYDYTDNRTRWAMLNTKDITRVEIIYSSQSEKSKKVIGRKYFKLKGTT